jgi:quercetin dioxygenase-like cupin family protein
MRNKLRIERQWLDEHPGHAFDETWLLDVSGSIENASDEKLRPIYKLENILKEGNANGFFKATVCPVKHFFTPGVYVRQMIIPAGVATVGHIHRYPCVTIVAYGDLLVTTVNGRERYGPGATFESPAGAKRAVYAIADSMLITVHGNPDNERDTDKIFANLIVDVYEKITGHPSKELKLEDLKP